MTNLGNEVNDLSSMDDIKKQIHDFQKKWPLEKIQDLILEEYSNDIKDSFTYDLEFGTKEVINISGGSSFRNGIYKRNSNSNFNEDGHRLTDNNYAWLAKYGKTADEAFRSVKSLIIQLIQIAQKGDELEIVDQIDLGHATKWKIVYMYNPELLLPIVSHEKLARIAQLKFNLNVEGKTFWEIQQEVTRQMPPDVDKYEFGKSLWEFDSNIGLNEILENFITQIDSEDLKFSHYPKDYSGLRLKVSFGKGNIAKVPWMAFLKEGKSVKSGIYPVILYFRKQEMLVVAYGHGEEKPSSESWDIEALTITDWFNQQNLGVPDRYGDSLVYNIYQKQNFNIDNISDDINTLIDVYNNIEIKNESDGNTIITPRYWLVKTGIDGHEWNYFQRKKMITIRYMNWPDLSEFKSKKEIEEKIPVYEQNWSGSNKNHLINLWGFSHEINVGDIIIAAKGTRTYLGYGVVTSPYYYYHKNYGARHRINVDWKKVGEWSIAKNETGFNIKTLLLMDQYEPWPQDVIKVMNGELILNSELAYTKVDALSELFMEEARLDQILSILERKKNIVLQGPPGTGKTFIAKRLAFCAMGRKDNSKVDMVQFHQSFSYEDFIQGYRPTETGNFSLVDGVFYRFCKRAKNDPNNKYFFIIDEINRGNLSKIFGELMLLIEGDKRGEHYAVSLTYQSDDDEQFYVPSNVYVIGTMNTADRSLAVVDYALRRRFSFISIHPKFNNQFKNFMSKYLDISFIDKISERLTTLNEEINSDVHLGEGFLIGHSYFCSTENIESPELWYEEIVQFEIEPLLNEYWFDEPEKVRSSIERLLQ